MKLSKLYNPIMIWLLKSPFHHFLSTGMTILHFSGRKSGNAYHVPVEYFTHEGDIGVFTQTDRIWWKNLQNDATMRLYLKGTLREGVANVFTGDATIFEAALQSYLEKYPGREKFFKVRRAADGTLNQTDVIERAKTMVFIRVALQV